MMLCRWTVEDVLFIGSSGALIEHDINNCAIFFFVGRRCSQSEKKYKYLHKITTKTMENYHCSCRGNIKCKEDYYL